MSDTDTADRRKIKVVVADDDAFTLSLVSDGLRALGFDVLTAQTAEEAGQLVAANDPHVLVTDLNFGRSETGASLLRRVHESSPWVALVVLTSHQSPELAVEDPQLIPADVFYVVKSQLKSIASLGDAVHAALSGVKRTEGDATGISAHISSKQAEVLRLLAAGSSVRAIAEQRGTSVRAAESMISRIYAALGLEDDESTNPRVKAIQLWHDGKIAVR